MPLSTGILTPDRYFLSGILGRDAVSGAKPDAPEEQLAIAVKRLRAALAAANLDASKLVYVNAYRTAALPAEKLRSALRKVAPEAAISVVEVSALPYGVSVGLTGVAVRDAAQKRVYRQAGEVLCASAGETVYCAAQGAAQVGDALAEIEKGLKSLGSSLTRAVANTVYLDDIDHFQTMNAAYALSFPAPPPTRTTVQPAPPAGKVSVAVVAVR